MEPAQKETQIYMRGHRVIDSTSDINILLAEDENAQRLCLVDMIETLLEYKVSEAENGKVAIEKLEKGNITFDLILLDLYMPEKDGFQVLNYIKSKESLKNIPVIMMSADNNVQNIAACLKMGAKNYLIKPIKAAFLQKQLKDNIKETVNVNEIDPNLVQYQKLKVIGWGATGKVLLVRKLQDDSTYALKIINLKIMSKFERAQVTNEIRLLKLLNGPTIIRYYESFIQDQQMHIIMEYAENGSIDERITQLKEQDKPLPPQQIISWMAQIILALTLMHSRSILHRDMKTQNLFLSSNDVIKLGDFGISKMLGEDVNTKTQCGTPYYMPPEVIKGQSYGQKADIWSLGCVLYELIMFRRPFQADTREEVYKKIQEDEPDPIPKDYNKGLALILSLLLQKVPSRRPTSMELAKLPCLHEAINSFADEYDCREFVQWLLTDHEDKKKEEKKEEDFQLQKSDLAKILEELKEFCPEMTRKNYPWSSPYKYITGKDISEYFEEKYPQMKDQFCEQGLEMFIEYEILFIADKRPNHDIGLYAQYLYKFDCGHKNPAINNPTIWINDVRKPLQISLSLIHLLQNVLKDCVRLDQYGEHKLQVEKIENNRDFKKFCQDIQELSKAEILTQTKQELIPFFLNLYQIMYTHYIIMLQLKEAKIKQNLDESEKSGFLSKTIKYMSSFLYTQEYYHHHFPPIYPFPKSTKFSRDTFIYSISGQNITIDLLKHGIIRGNKPPPGHYFSLLKKGDQLLTFLKKGKFTDSISRKSTMLFFENEMLPEQIISFNHTNYIMKINTHCQDFLTPRIYYDNIECEVILPKILMIYKRDFANNDFEAFKWAIQLKKHQDAKQILNIVEKFNIRISYYDN